MVRAFIFILTLPAFAPSTQAAFLPHGGSGSAGGGGGPCAFTGSVAGSCLPSTDTTHSIQGPRQSAPRVADIFNFSGNGNAQLNGQGMTCPGNFGNATGDLLFTSCSVTPSLHVCTTPGNIASNTHPWATEDMVSWVAPPVTYNAHNVNVFYSGVPTFTPTMTVANTAGFASLSVGSPGTALMTSLCGMDTSAYFVSSTLGNMPNLRDALRTMRSNDTLTISAPPAGIPYWPAGELFVGPNGGANPPYDITVSIAAGASFGYPAPNDKGLFVISHNGTTIDGGTCYWVNPGNNQACIAWVSGLDLTVKNFHGSMAGMGTDRGNVRNGISNWTNVTLEDNGCMDSSCNIGLDHNMYLLSQDYSSGFDVLFADNLALPDVMALGWNIKLRTPSSRITNSFMGARINSGFSASHGPADFPCGGDHSITNSVLEANGFSLNYYYSRQPSSFLVYADEERGAFCLNRVRLPTAPAFAATVTGINSFTTMTNPVSFAHLLTAGDPTQYVWDKGLTGTMPNGPAQLTGWSGPDGSGNYTVTVQCFTFEGTVPLIYNGTQVYSCFMANGPITLYGSGDPIHVLTNSNPNVSFSTPVDPRSYGISVRNQLSDDTGNTLIIASITGTGPYTVSATCAIGSDFDGAPCLTLPAPRRIIVSNPVASGTYNSATGAVSLVIGTDVGYIPGSKFTLSNLYGTGAVSSLNGTWTATAGTRGTTLNFTGPTGLGAITIGSTYFGGVGSGDAAPANLSWPIKEDANIVVASTTGSGCDGTSTLCGIAVRPDSQFIPHGLIVTTGPNIAAGYGCMTAGQISFIHPVGGKSGTGYAVGNTITLAGGTGPIPAVVTVATTGAGGSVTSVTITKGGVYTSFITSAADHKTWTQASTSGSGTEAQFEFPLPTPIFGGSGPYTLRLAQPSGANCITGASTNQTYTIERPTIINFSNDIFGWDGPCTYGPCSIYLNAVPHPWKRATVSNSLFWTNTSASEAGPIGPTWSNSGVGNVLSYGMTDGGGNVQCNNRKDLATSPRCAIPPFTAATFTGGITGNTLTVGCVAGTSCMTITSGTYNSTTGIVTLTVPVSNAIPFWGDRSGNGQSLFSVSGLTGTGALSTLNGNWQAATGTAGTTLTYQADPGLGAITITGGNVNAASVASACAPGMFIWDNSGEYNIGETGHIWGGWTIVSGSAPTFTIGRPPGGIVTTDIPAGTVLACGWGTPASAFNGTVNSSGVLTINSGLVGSVHVGDYLTDIFSALPANVRIQSGSGTTWQTNYSGSGVAAEYMVSVRSQTPLGAPIPGWDLDRRSGYRQPGSDR
jgi:hypothetical protein